MNQKELNELRRRFKLDKNSISNIFGCYVNSSREIISWVDAPMGMMRQEEQEMYLGLLKKALSGTLGKNLVDVVFSTHQVADSDECRLLQTLRQTELKDSAARETLCRQIIDSLDMGESNYLILLAADAYDVPHRGKDDVRQDDGGDSVFRYFVCAVCPVKTPKLDLRYDLELNEFHPDSTGHTASAPELGFLYPAFDGRSANLYNVLFYSKNAAQIHQEVIDALFHVEPPMSAAEQKSIFETCLTEALGGSCAYDTVRSVYEQLLEKLEAHKESRDPEPLELTVHELGDILTSSGAEPEQVETFRKLCGERYGENAVLNPDNLIESKRFELLTEEAKLSLVPDSCYRLEARVIDGRKYFLIPAETGAQLNGIPVDIPAGTPD